jgi:hypothetical protein
MNALAIVLGVLGVVAIWRWERWSENRQADRQAIEIQRLAQERDATSRELALKEREIVIQERIPPKVDVPPPTEFPPQILAFVSNESEPWARDDGLLLIAEAYVESGGDWERAAGHLSHRYAMQQPSRLPKELLN